MRRVACLDGLRGLAALWVLIGHCMILTGWGLPVLGAPDLGVDLFILLSGFLMTFQYQLRSRFEDWTQPKVWAGFWIRRFFRIAPLYYVLLAVALLLGPAIYADRVLIDTALATPTNYLQLPTRYLDASFTNLLAHLSFVFGLIPSYAFRTPLPDWSLGLEMQFYLVFPLLTLLAHQVGWIKMTLIAAAFGVCLVMLFHLAGIHFPMPSFLPLKLHLFLCGMLIAIDYNRESNPIKPHTRIILLLTLAALPIGGHYDTMHILLRESIVLGFFALIHWQSNPLINKLETVLSTHFFHWLGELSFGVYLIHLLIMHRVAAWTFDYGLEGKERFMVVLAITATLSYGLAAITFFLIERPGQRLGKALVRLTIENKP